MFIKKFLYKITDPRKHHEYKINLAIERKKKWYKLNFQDKISTIQKKIHKQKEISFLHSGHLGDIIDSLAVIKELSKTHKCSLYIEANKTIDVKYNKHPGGKVFLNKKMVNMLLPLLKKQNFIDQINLYASQEIDIDLNLFKELAMNLGLGSVRWYSHVTGIYADLSKPYLISEPHKTIKNKIVIMRTNRRNNYLINYRFLNKYNDLLFIGLLDEYNILKKEVPNIEFYDCKDFLELTEIIKSCKFFLGNLCFGYSVAEALKVPRLLECVSEYSAMHPSGQNAYEFYFQEHFEKWFKQLYNL